MSDELKETSNLSNYGSLKNEGADEEVFHDQEHDVEDGSAFVKHETSGTSPRIPTSRKVISALLLAGLFSGAGYMTVTRSWNHPAFLDDARLGAIQGNPGMLLTPQDQRNVDYTKSVLEDRVAKLQQELYSTQGSLGSIYQLLNIRPPVPAEAAMGQVPASVEQLGATPYAGQATDPKDLMISQLQQELQQLQQQIQQLLQQQQPLPQPLQPQQLQPQTIFHPFASTQELYRAVDAYVGPDMAQRAAVMSYYGSPMGSWDVSQISDFSHLFDNDRCDDCDFFNEDLSGWDVSRATSMASMFEGEKYFNQDLSTWDVRGVQDFTKMFSGCKSFNQNLSSWMLSATALSRDMFKGIKHFNPAFQPQVSQVSPMFPGSNQFPGSNPFPGGYPPYYNPNWNQ